MDEHAVANHRANPKKLFKERIEKRLAEIQNQRLPLTKKQVLRAKIYAIATFVRYLRETRASRK